jgi:hypothetical protein
MVYIPPGTSAVPVASFNMADRLCTRLVAQVYADPPLPEAEPERGDPEAEAAAEFSTRVLMDLQSEANLDDLGKHRLAFDLANTWGSGFVHYLVDPCGGGLAPVDVQAHPQAQTMDAALHAHQQTPMGPMPLATPANPAELTQRYATPDAGLTDNVEEAAYRWLPGLDAEVIPADGVRFLPDTARDIWEARGVLLARYEPFREVEHELEDDQTEEGDRWTDEDVEAMARFRPAPFKHLLPKLPGGKTYDPEHENVRDRLVLTVRCYWQACRAYPTGAHVLTVGEQVAFRRPWIGARDNGSKEVLDLPVTQIKQLSDPENPMGRPMMHFLSGANEARLQMLGTFQDYLDRIARRKTFVPVGSTYQAKDAQLAFSTTIPIQNGMEPRYEEIPPLDQNVPGFYDRVTGEMQDAVGLQAAGANLLVPSITSGRQALAVISQAQAGLSEIRQNAERAYVRGCRIQLQLVRHFFTSPQRLRWLGEDGEYKEQAWMGSDLGSTRDVRILQGSMTMLSPMQKVELAFGWAQHGGVPPEQVQQLLRSKVTATIGLQDDPHLLRVRRQIAAWREGPPPEWQPGVVLPIFAPVMADQLPQCANTRLKETAAVLASRRFQDAAPEWQQVMVEMFMAANQALQPPPPPGTAPPQSGGGGGSPGTPPTGSVPPLQKEEQAVLGQSAEEPGGLRGGSEAMPPSAA